MRRIIQRREIIADPLRYPGEPAGSGTIAVQPLTQWLSGEPSAEPAALLLTATDAVESLQGRLAGVHWIVIEFAKIGEGRGYSQARLLRRRLGYAHELRARGALKRDQLQFLARSGFDAFDLDPTEDLIAALAGFDAFTVAYQDGDEAVLSLRRRPAAAPG